MKFTTLSILLASVVTIIAAPIPTTNTATGTSIVPDGTVCSIFSKATNAPNTDVTVPGDQGESAGDAESVGKNHADQSSTNYANPGSAQSVEDSAGCSNSGVASAASAGGAGSGSGNGETTSSQVSSAAAAITNKNAQNAQAESETIAKSQSLKTPLGTFSVSGAGSEAAAFDENGDAALAADGGLDIGTPLDNLDVSTPTLELAVGQATSSADSGKQSAGSNAGGSAGAAAVAGTTRPLTTVPGSNGSAENESQSLNNENGNAGSVSTAGGSTGQNGQLGTDAEEDQGYGDGGDAAGAAAANPNGAAAAAAAGNTGAGAGAAAGDASASASAPQGF